MSDPTEQPENLTVPAELGPDHVDAETLGTLQTSLQEAIDALVTRAETDADSITADDAARMAELSGALAAVDAEVTRRTEEHQSNVAAVLDAAAAVRPAAAADDPPAEGDPPADPAPEVTPAPDAPVEAPAVVDAAPAEAVAASARQPVTVPAVARRSGTLNPTSAMAAVARNAPTPRATTSEAAELVITAAADLVGSFTENGRLPDLAALGDAMVQRAKGMGISKGNGMPAPVASIHRQFDHVLEEGASIPQVTAAFDALLAPARSRSGMEGLVAAGGWCAPSEITYEFFDLTGPPSGMVDLPTIGIRRGGIRWPDSLDLAQFFALSGAAASGVATNATMPWLWTEADDIVAATGDTPVKSCLRPPCPEFNEERLWLLGICVLAGNLTDDAYPELLRHYLSLVMVAHERVMNRRFNALMDASGLTVVAPTLGDASSATTHMLGALDLIGRHERLRIGMSENAVLQVDLPTYVPGLVRSDMAKRNGWDDVSLVDEWFARQLDVRNLRASYVEDWQHATGWAAPAGTMGADTAPTAWPSSFYARMYAPGHFFRGNGMTLNLGVVRDSVLNAQNDFTAAWSEEAALLGVRGNRAYRVDFTNMFPEGTTGAQTAQSAASA